MPSEKIDPINIPDNINKMNSAVTEASNIPASIKQIITTENTNINIFFRPNRSLNIPRSNCVIRLPSENKGIFTDTISTSCPIVNPYTGKMQCSDASKKPYVKAGNIATQAYCIVCLNRFIELTVFTLSSPELGRSFCTRKISNHISKLKVAETINGNVS